jgi:hypothetical protein
MRCVGLAVALLLAGCSAPTAPDDAGAAPALPPPPPGKGAIAGLVIDDIYRPVPGALVLVERLGLTVTTDASGQFAFTDLEPGSYVLIANAQRHEAAPTNVDVVEGEYADAEVQARRVFSDDGTLVTTRYSVFVNCAASAFIVTALAPCLPDASGDSHRDHFEITDEPYGANATALVLEMKASQPDGYAVHLGCDDVNAGTWTEGTGDYIRTGLLRGNRTLPEDGPGTSFGKWPAKCHDLVARLWYLGGDPAGTRDGGITSWGVGARVAIKATFLVSVFVGEPRQDLATYSVLGPA